MRVSLLFLLALSFTSQSLAQIVSIKCEYAQMTINNNLEYGCWLTLSNSAGYDNFLSINGEHEFGLSNENVTILLRDVGITPLVPRIICEQFPHLKWAALNGFGINRLTDTSFGGCRELEVIDLNANQISEVDQTIFANNPHLTSLDLSRGTLTTIATDTFERNPNLSTLNLSFNRLSVIPIGVFSGLDSLRILYLQFNELASVTGVFEALPLLERLYLYGNLITRLESDSFGTLESIEYLDISQNPLTDIENGAFRFLFKLQYLIITECELRNLHADSFGGLSSLLTLNLDFNQLEELPAGVFAPLLNLFTLNLWGNQLKTLARNHFGNLHQLTVLDLDDNAINAIELSVIDEAMRLSMLLMSNNLCASFIVNDFQETRVENLARLARCFRNFEFVVEATTDSSLDYQFFAAPEPGIQLRVLTSDAINIALTSANTTTNPMIEIFIGSGNNTRSSIWLDGETEVDISTPNIISGERSNGFRVTWANSVVMVNTEGDPWPFMVFTMREAFSVNFYGFRTPETQGTWSIQPV